MPDFPLANPEIEKKLLALAINHPEAALLVQKHGGEELFSGGQRREIWRAIGDLLERKVPVQYSLIRDALDSRRGRKANNLDKLLHEASGVPLADAGVYVPILADYAERRRLSDLAATFSKGVFDFSAPLHEVKAFIHSEIHKKTNGSNILNESKNLYEALPTISETLKIFKTSDNVASFPFVGLSKITSTLKPGQLALLAARPSMGKTTFAINTAVYVALTRPVLFFSFEMGSEEIVLKILASYFNVPHTRLWEPKALQWMLRPRGKVQETLKNMYIYDNISPTLASVKAIVYDFIARGITPGLIVIDYVQLMGAQHSDKDHSREREISLVSRGLKLLAKEAKSPILALSQLNRRVEERVNKTPVLSDLRDSGSLEQDADLVVFLFREDYYRKDAVAGMTDVLVLKNRMGATGTATIYLDAEKSRFYEGA